MNVSKASPLTAPPPKAPLTSDEYQARVGSLLTGVDRLESMIRSYIEEEKKQERISELGGRIYDIAVPARGDKPGSNPVFDMIMKMRGEMMAFDPLERRSKALASEAETIAEDFDTTRLEKLSGDPAFVKKILRQEEYEKEFAERYKSAKRWNAIYRDDKKKTKDQLKTEVDEKLMAEYKENREKVARQLSKLYEEMANVNPKSFDYEDFQTEWFDALDTHEYPEELIRDVVEEGGDADTFIDEDGNEKGHSYRTYERVVYVPKNAPYKLIYKHTTDVLTDQKDEDGNWDFSGEVEEDDLIYDDERGYYLVPKY